VAYFASAPDKNVRISEPKYGLLTVLRQHGEQNLSNATNLYDNLPCVKMCNRKVPKNLL